MAEITIHFVTEGVVGSLSALFCTEDSLLLHVRAISALLARVSLDSKRRWKADLCLGFKKVRRWGNYFLGLGLGLGLALGLAFSAALTSFIGMLQHIRSHVWQPQSSSTTIRSPHSSHLYFCPFLLAKNSSSSRYQNRFYLISMMFHRNSWTSKNRIRRS